MLGINYDNRYEKALKFYGGGEPEFKTLADFVTPNMPWLGEYSNKKTELDSEIYDLKIKYSKLLNDLKGNEKKLEELEELNKVASQLKQKEQITHILTRINGAGKSKILESTEFLEKFANRTKCEAVVVSIDIRRSTELMLKAKTPEMFSDFITKLSSSLAHIITENFGIFDKFTGDGILAFFPKFYSGEQAILNAIKASEQCHKLFNLHYNANKKSFSVFITNIGLGIGIDYGNITLVNTSNELTVVGIPVVYACRMSSAKAGDTVLNIPAYEELGNVYGEENINYDEVLIEIKNEGTALAYKVESKNNNGLFNKISNPHWLEDNKEEIEDSTDEEEKTKPKDDKKSA